MAEVYHKNCYMSRSPGYKYRTLATNTGEKKRRDSYEDNTFDRKLKELKRVMCSKIHTEVDKMADARDSIREKFNKIDAKVTSMIELQQALLDLRGRLQQAECKLATMLNKVDKIELAAAITDPYSLHSRKSSYRSQPAPIFEEKEIFESNITHI